MTTEISKATTTPKERRKHPNIKKIGDGKVQVEATDMAMVRDLYGVKTSDAANGLMVSALDALGENGQPGGVRRMRTSLSLPKKP